MTEYKGNGKGSQANLDPLNKEKPIQDLLGKKDTLENLVVY